jgi:hypothetical protein
MSWSAAVWLGWLGLFVALELPSLWGRVPWSTLSAFVRGLEATHPMLPYAIATAFAMLTVHLVVGQLA